MPPDPLVELEPVGPDNFIECLDIEGNAPGEPRFVASTTYSLAQAYVDRVARDRGEPNPDRRPYLARSEGEPVGFVLVGRDPDDERAVRLHRVMVDHRLHGRGYGRALVAAALTCIAEEFPGRDVRLIYDPENARAERLYRSLGFEVLGESEEGNVVAAYRARRATGGAAEAVAAGRERS